MIFASAPWRFASPRKYAKLFNVVSYTNNPPDGAVSLAVPDSGQNGTAHVMAKEISNKSHTPHLIFLMPFLFRYIGILHISV
jgi:hypothetical protein